jgi:hypothetical protein
MVGLIWISVITFCVVVALLEHKFSANLKRGIHT